MKKLKSYLSRYGISVFVSLLCLFFLFMLQGCTSYLDEVDENPNLTALLSTKSVAIVCVDVFATWEGEFIYVGTACNSSGSGSSGGNIDIGNIGSDYGAENLTVTEPYDAGGSISGGGGGSYNSRTGNTEYFLIWQP